MLTPDEGQELAIDFCLKKRYAILPLPPGTGKTLVGVEVARRTGLNTLVVLPSYARNVWVKEFRGQCGSSIDLYNFKANKDIVDLENKKGVALLSYSLLTDNKKENKLERSDKLFEWADVIIADEIHFCKSVTNKRTQAFHQLIYENRPEYVVLLSGTVAKNRIHELYSPICLCAYRSDDSQFLKEYPTFDSFAEKFSIPHAVKFKTKRGFMKTVIQYKGYRNLNDLRDILKKCYFKLPDRLLAKLPERTVINVESDKVYKDPELMTAFDKFVASNKGNAITKAKAEAAKFTAKFTAKFAENIIEKMGCVVVFTDHIDSCKIIAEKLKVVPIYGEVSVDKRLKLVDDFQEGKTDAIVATIGTLSTAISLVRSTCMILNDPPWVPGDLEQTEKRILRRGQKNHCTYYRILATPESERIYEVLESKREDLKQIDKLMEKRK